MFSSIRWRIALPYLVLILVSMLALGVYISSRVRQTYLADLESKLAAEGHMIGDVITPDLQTAGAAPDLDPQAEHWAAILNARVTIIAPDGTVWGESTEDRALMANHRDRPEVIQALASGVGSSSRYSQTLGYDMMYTAVAVKTNQKILALVRVALPMQQVSANVYWHCCWLFL
jgi:two-component system phosphate regulon sensor histidine kinase PhoR